MSAPGIEPGGNLLLRALPDEVEQLADRIFHDGDAETAQHLAETFREAWEKAEGSVETFLLALAHLNGYALTREGVDVPVLRMVIVRMMDRAALEEFRLQAEKAGSGALDLLNTLDG